MLFVLAFTLLGLGLFFLHQVYKTEDKEPRQLNATMIIIGSIFGFILLWLSLHSGIENENIATMISLVIYTIIGLICYFYGLINGKKCRKIYGGVVVGLVVIRLLLIDIQMMDLTGRIITFFLIGTLLVSTAFIGKNIKKQSISDK